MIMVNRIKTLREQAHLTQREVAKLLDVDEPTVSRWESGRRPLSPGVIEKLAAMFKVSSWELFMDRDGLRGLAGQADGEPMPEKTTMRTAKADPSDRDAMKRHDAL